MIKNLSKQTIIIIILIIVCNTIIPSIDSHPTILINSTRSESVTTLPHVFNWRNINGTDYTTTIKNQAPCPSCEAYAIVAALETMIQYTIGYPFDCDLSEMHLFFASGGTCRWGVYLQNCTNYLIEYGVPDEGCFPDPHRSVDTSINETLSGWETRTVKIQDWGWIDLNQQEIKQALIEYGPLVICALVYTDFMAYNKGIYRNLWGKIQGGHVMTLVGYNDHQRYWLIKNSWGSDWGEDGWIKVSYDAHRPLRPFFKGFYGGSGILYMDGVYGNFQPDVPKIYIQEPQRGKMYLNDFSWKKSLLRKFLIKRGEAIIIKGTTINLDTSNNTQKVEYYLNKNLSANITSSPYAWYLPCETQGLHELRVIAYDANNNASMDIMDIITIPLKLN